MLRCRAKGRGAQHDGFERCAGLPLEPPRNFSGEARDLPWRAGKLGDWNFNF